jgi:ABC-type antimicrobial peptide transport system permease subunit
MVLIALAALVALMLGIVGVYAVVAFSTTQRRTEMAVRLAVGATPADLTRMQVRQGSRPILAGVLVGLGAAAAAGRALQALLFGVTARDPAAYAVAGALLLTVALLSCWYPARRAARISPADALRG